MMLILIGILIMVMVPVMQQYDNKRHKPIIIKILHNANENGGQEYD